MKKRILSVILCLCMVLIMMPMTAMAVSGGEGKAYSLTPTLTLMNTDSINFGAQGYCYLTVKLSNAKACHRYSVEINGVDNEIGVIAEPQYYVSDHNGVVYMFIIVNRTDEMKNDMSAKITVKDLEEYTVACEKKTVIYANDDKPYFKACNKIEMQGAERVDFNELEIHNLGANTSAKMELLDMNTYTKIWESNITSDENGIFKPSVRIVSNDIHEDHQYLFILDVNGTVSTSDDVRIFKDIGPSMNFDTNNGSSSEIELSIEENYVNLTAKIQNMIERSTYKAYLVQIGKSGTDDTDNYIVKDFDPETVSVSCKTINLRIPKEDLSSKEKYKFVFYNIADKDKDNIGINISFTKQQLDEIDDADKVAAVKNVVTTLLTNFTATNSTTQADIIALVDDAKTSTGYTDVAGSFGATFNKDNATTSAAGSVSGTITLTCGSSSDTISVAKTIAQLSNTIAQCPKTDAEKVNTDISSSVPVGNVSGMESAYNTISTDNTKGYTQADKDIVNAGGSALIYIKAEAISGSTTGLETLKSKISSDGKTLGIFINFNVFKEITAIGASTPNKTQLIELPEVITVTIDIPEDEQGMSNYAIYRYHEGAVDVITTTPNADGEYIEVSADGKQIILHIKKFSEYAIAYSEKEVVTTESSKTEITNPKTGDNSNMILWVALLFISGCVTSLTIYTKRTKSEAR